MEWGYAGREDGRAGRDVVRVSARVEVIAGVRCAVVLDRLYLDGRLRERTTDWYAQDSRGDVRYYGEATAELDRRGRVVSREGSWRAGRDGAHSGLYMPAHPRLGQEFQQEHHPRHPEDRFSVQALHASVRVPLGRFRALRTREWTPLEPGIVDRKWYVRGIGQVAEATVRGGHDKLRLRTFHR